MLTVHALRPLNNFLGCQNVVICLAFERKTAIFGKVLYKIETNNEKSLGFDSAVRNATPSNAAKHKNVMCVHKQSREPAYTHTGNLYFLQCCLPEIVMSLFCL